MYIYCDRPSRSAALLRRAAGLKRLRPPLLPPPLGIKVFNVNKYLIPVLNWGCTNVEFYRPVINPPAAVERVCNKLLFFKTVAENSNIPLPPWTTSHEVAQQWANEGKIVVCRTKLTSHSGEGIVIPGPFGAVPPAPLYTQYIKKETEWRVHVFGGQVIDVQRKARRLDVADNLVNWAIRTYQNGFTYVRGNLEDYGLPLLENIKNVALQTVAMFPHLTFGAVDIVVTRGQQPYVLEINSAPGLEGTTLDKYVTEIKKLLK